MDTPTHSGERSPHTQPDLGTQLATLVATCAHWPLQGLRDGDGLCVRVRPPELR